MFANDRKWSLLMRYSWSVYDDVGFVYSHGRGAQQPLCSACVSSIRVTILLYHLFSRCSNVTALQSIWFHLPLCAYHKPQYVTSCHQLNLQLTDHINVTELYAYWKADEPDGGKLLPAFPLPNGNLPVDRPSRRDHGCKLYKNHRNKKKPPQIDDWKLMKS